MYTVISFVEVLYIELEEIAHDIVKHKETCCLLHWTFVSVVEQVKDRTEDLVHTLDVLSPRVDLSKHEQNTSHIVIPVGLAMLLFFILPVFYHLLILAVHNLPLLLPHSCHIRNHHWFSRRRKKCQF